MRIEPHCGIRRHWRGQRAAELGLFDGLPEVLATRQFTGEELPCRCEFRRETIRSGGGERRPVIASPVGQDDRHHLGEGRVDHRRPPEVAGFHPDQAPWQFRAIRFRAAGRPEPDVEGHVVRAPGSREEVDVEEIAGRGATGDQVFFLDQTDRRQSGRSPAHPFLQQARFDHQIADEMAARLA